MNHIAEDLEMSVIYTFLIATVMNIINEDFLPVWIASLIVVLITYCIRQTYNRWYKRKHWREIKKIIRWV